MGCGGKTLAEERKRTRAKSERVAYSGGGPVRWIRMRIVRFRAQFWALVLWHAGGTSGREHIGAGAVGMMMGHSWDVPPYAHSSLIGIVKGY